MPQLRRSAAAPPASQIEFAFAPALDLLNAMYFTFLASGHSPTPS